MATTLAPFGRSVNRLYESPPLCKHFTLLEMLTLLASDWTDLIRDLEGLHVDAKDENFFELTAGKRDRILRSLDRIQQSCEKLDLKFSASYVGDIVSYVADRISLDEQIGTRFRIDDKTLLDPKKFQVDIEILRKRIDDELKGREFFALESWSVNYFQKPTLFGDEVFANFPTANDDIYEAGTCLALGRSTACVMHLMRAVEVGLTVLTRELGLPTRHDWGKHLVDVENELTKRYKVSGSRTPDESFFAESAAQIGHIKTAWRNPTMHVDRAYSEDHAEEILIAVRSLLRHLASRLHE